MELGEGFSGHLAINEPYFDCLDAAPMVVALVFLTMSHPIFTFQHLETCNVTPVGELERNEMAREGSKPENEAV